ncbi:helix-turn-helix domain-containing protein [Sphingobacterium faecium]|uniref:helix-turn-helix domain-containing protein n=1 Tax=Sphingobacterium faecium TaxID=34087 RepID=UPI0032094C8A
MNKLEIIADFFNRIKNDPVIDPVHISLYMALFHLSTPEVSEVICIERQATMCLSKICSPATYYRKLRELNEKGLIKYYPSKKKTGFTRVSLRRRRKVENERIITYQDLLDFKEELIKEIRSICTSNTPSRKWLKSSEVRKLLGLSATKLQIMRNKDEIPFTRVGGVIYYLEEAVHQMLESNSNINVKR